MNFAIRTTVSNSKKENIIAAFDSSLFMHLAPPFPNLKLLRFDGCKTGDEIHLELNFFLYKQKWISLVTDHNIHPNEIYFIDEGTVLPIPLKFWKHHHRIIRIGTAAIIEDNITYKSWNKIVDNLLFPFFYLLFYYRKPIYRKYLSGLNGKLIFDQKINNLQLPPKLFELVEAGIWPESIDDIDSQNMTPIINVENIKKFAPEENTIYLYAPPFKTIHQELSTNTDYWHTYGALDQIDPQLAVILGDFGIGSDTCLILDYRENLSDPKVFRLVWSDNNYWEKVADNFDEFCIIAGIINKKT